MVNDTHTRRRSEKSSDFDEILYTVADFELDIRHVIKNEKVALDRLRVRQNVFLVTTKLNYCYSTVVLKITLPSIMMVFLALSFN